MGDGRKNSADSAENDSFHITRKKSTETLCKSVACEIPEKENKADTEKYNDHHLAITYSVDGDKEPTTPMSNPLIVV